MSTQSTHPGKEEWYMWKEIVQFDDEPQPRFITPRSNPMEYEYPVDLLFETATKAVAWLEEERETVAELDAEAEDDTEAWVLVRVTLERVA
jgi:hypothetical protein